MTTQGSLIVPLLGKIDINAKALRVTDCITKLLFLIFKPNVQFIVLLNKMTLLVSFIGYLLLSIMFLHNGHIYFAGCATPLLSALK